MRRLVGLLVQLCAKHLTIMTFDVKYSSKQAPLLSAVVAKFLGIVVKFSTVKGNDAAPVLNDSEAG